jgi:hypothetical protein
VCGERERERERERVRERQRESDVMLTDWLGNRKVQKAVRYEPEGYSTLYQNSACFTKFYLEPLNTSSVSVCMSVRAGTWVLYECAYLMVLT